jgi:serine/threonine protein kinase
LSRPVTVDHAQLLASLAQPGDLIAGKYRVDRVLAVGGMGVVMAARNEDLDQQVVLKLLRQDVGATEEAAARFVREARTAAKLQGEHVARVFDVGTTETGIPYMVMERLNGLDLQELIDTDGPLPVRDAVDYVLQALEAVAEAHAAGVVHRDLKPSNLFLASRPDGSQHIKVLDFGISKPHGIDSPITGPVLTSPEQVIGSPGFMSPEQMTRPRDVDGRADVWSIGVVLYTLLVGEPPFQGETVAAVMANVLYQNLPRVRDKRPDAPAAIQRIIERCLDRDPGTRFSHVTQVARSLAPLGSSWAKLSLERIENALDAASPAGRTLLLHAEKKPGDSGAVAAAAWAGVPPRPGVRNKQILRFGLALALLGLGGGLLWLSLSSRAPSGSQAASAAAQAGDTSEILPPALPSSSSTAAAAATLPQPAGATADPSTATPPVPATSSTGTAGARESRPSSSHAPAVSKPSLTAGAAAPKGTGPKRPPGAGDDESKLLGERK